MGVSGKRGKDEQEHCHSLERAVHFLNDEMGRFVMTLKISFLALDHLPTNRLVLSFSN